MSNFGHQPTIWTLYSWACLQWHHPLPELCQARVGVLLFADSHWEPEPNHDEGGHHSCQQSSREGPSQWVSQCLSDQALTAHLGPRPSPTALTLLVSVFSSKWGCDAHYLCADTHNAKLFPQVPGKGSDNSPRGKDNQVVIKTKQVRSR